MADLAVRQLIIAKTMDAINLRLGHQSNFPFIIVAKVDTGTTESTLPASWIWDLHASLPKKWEKVRLAKIKRISGENGTTITGKLRLIFTASQQGSAAETSIFFQDYTIDSDLDFQLLRLQVVTSTEESNAIEAGEQETIGGFIIFRTLDTDDEEVIDFFEALAPPVGATDADSDGLFDAPAEYEIVDSTSSPSTGEYNIGDIIHGTGSLVASAWNAIPNLDSDVNTWLSAFNFPFKTASSRTSSSPIVLEIPSPLFKEFSLCVPCGDEPTGDTSGEFSPIWISKIRRCDDTAQKMQVFFATYNIVDGSASTTPVEFARLELERDFVPDQVVEIVPIEDLLLNADASEELLFRQGFGEGHVTLSSLWSATSSEVTDFFDSLLGIIDDPADLLFAKSASLLGAPGSLDRNPRTVPTKGQFDAAKGSTARLENPIHPSDDVRFITEGDQGLGDQIDFRDVTDISDNPDIEPIGCSGGLAHRVVKLLVNASGPDHDYDDDVLPRLRVLLGRDPQFGDFWWDGTRLKFWNGDAWIG
jgi:hypothetical protein